MAKCPKCRLWEIKSSDRYCSWCGEKLLALEINPLKMRFYIDRDKAKCSHKNRIVMKNSGWTEIKPISITFDHTLFEISNRSDVLKQEEERVLDIKLLDSAEIEPGKSSPIIIEGGGQKFQVLVEFYYTPSWNLTLEGQTVQPESTQKLFKYSEVVEAPFHLDRLDRTVFDIEKVFIDGGRHEITGNECGKDYFSGHLRIDAGQVKTGRPEFVGLSIKGRDTEYAVRIPFYISLEVPPDFRVMVQGKSCKPGEREELEMYEGIENELQLKIINSSSTPLHIERIETEQPFSITGASMILPLELPTKGDIILRLSIDPTVTKSKYTQASISVFPREIKSKKYDFRIEKKKAPEYKGILAVDFGTTNTTAAYEKDTFTYLVPLEEIFSDLQRRELLASVIRYIRIKDDTPQEYVIGENARSLMIFHPRSTVMSIKTRLGEREKIKVIPTEKNSNPGEFTAVEVTSHILEWLRKTAENHLKKRVTRAVITHPSKFTHIQVQQLKTAFERAGIQVRDTIEEPQATAINYIIQNKEKSGKEDSYVIGVFDCGGGTTDITLIEANETQADETRNIFVKVLATDGDARFGGNDLTEIMMDIIAQKINNKEMKFNGEVEDIDGLHFFYTEKDERNEDIIRRMITLGKEWETKIILNRKELGRVAEDCKIQLSDKEVLSISTNVELLNRNDEMIPFVLNLEIKREDFESRIKSIIENFIDKLKRMEKKTGRACDVVLLSGLSSKIPLFYQSFFDHYRDKVKYAADLKKCVVRGAVEYYDKSENSGDIILEFDRGQKLTSPIGIRKTNREGKREFVELFPQGADVPTEPVKINQTLRRHFKVKVMRNLGTRDIIDEAPREFEEMAIWEIDIPDNISDMALKTGKFYLQVDEALNPKLSVQVGDYLKEYIKEE
ncbi:MAG: Hsp70 family protein [Candidatus Aminicenantes bacterium]|nr:Hsp70 family protein [Candidatus Aminicenantes bacterium]